MKIEVRITATAGSTPRDSGTVMHVWAEGQSGTIGGGALEHEATRIARQMLVDGRTAHRQTFPLGPSLGQCCGGSVTLGFAAQADVVAESEGKPLWIYGAGHVGRALVQVLHPLPEFAITWVDTGTDRFPEDIPAHVSPLVATDPALVVRHAPRDADHLILTYSHELDLALCHALLGHGFSSVGLIGSATKWARFRSRLGALGHTPAQISRIACPIGDPSLGKHPTAIAIGVAASLLGADARANRGERTG